MPRYLGIPTGTLLSKLYFLIFIAQISQALFSYCRANENVPKEVLITYICRVPIIYFEVSKIIRNRNGNPR